MAVVRTLVTLKLGETYFSPGSVLSDFDDDEAERLKGRFLEVISVGNPVAPAQPSPPAAVLPVEAPVTANAPTPAAGEPANRVSEVRAALDLLDDADFDDGHPDLVKLAEALGWEPTAAEVDAAIELHESGL